MSILILWCMYTVQCTNFHTIKRHLYVSDILVCFKGVQNIKFYFFHHKWKINLKIGGITNLKVNEFKDWMKLKIGWIFNLKINKFKDWMNN